MNIFKRWFQSLSRHVCDEELYTNINGCLDLNCPIVRERKPLPKKAPPAPPPPPRY